MDAWCLIDIIKFLSKLAEEKGEQSLLLENAKHSLNYLETNRDPALYNDKGQHRGN